MNDKYLGMTVNERLFVSGLLKDFDKAVEQNDRSKIVEILKKVELKEVSIRDIIVSLKLNKANNK
jgi:hypothetical protein